jgi:hypothetical protein
MQHKRLLLQCFVGAAREPLLVKIARTPKRAAHEPPLRRKGRALDFDEQIHYQKIINASFQTHALM